MSGWMVPLSAGVVEMRVCGTVWLIDRDHNARQ